ncbi:MAG TPA: hypothetical protein VJ201_08335 [Candidatus Babeliales bacterium]|nr:hypothetical protein [Candidatus Babeliales bacterium]
MKKILLILAVTFAFSGCEKKEEVKKAEPNGTMIFYKTHNTADWTLIWEGVECAHLKYAVQSPPCGAAGFITKDVKPGTYDIGFKSYSGLAWSASGTKVTIVSGQCKFYPYN